MADLGLGIVVLLAKGATILPVTSVSAVVQPSAKGGEFTG